MKMKSKVLVVDDEPDVTEFLRRRFEKNDFDVLVASSGRECLDILQNERPDAVVLDIIMPEMDGYEVLARIYKKYLPGQMPVIMLSARKESQAILRSMDLGSVDYMMKPVDFSKLLKTVRKYTRE